MKSIFELLTSPLGLPIPTIWEWVILAIIGAIAFRIAWKVSPGGEFGSAIHWIVRFGIFIILWAVAYGIILLFQWLFDNWIVVLCVTVGIIVVGIIIWLVLRYKHRKKEDKLNARNEK